MEREQASSPELMAGYSAKVQQATGLCLKRHAGQEGRDTGVEESQRQTWFGFSPKSCCMLWVGHLGSLLQDSLLVPHHSKITSLMILAAFLNISLIPPLSEFLQTLVFLS